MSEKIFILCCMASCMESCNSPSADVPCVRVSAHPSAPASLLPLFNCRSRPSLDSTVPSLTMGCRFRYMQWLPVLVKWKRSILQTERVLPAARRRETRSAHVPGHSADLAATVERLEESWEKADSERQVSEEEKSRRLAQGRWREIFLMKAEQNLHSRPMLSLYNQARLAAKRQWWKEKYWVQLASSGLYRG